MSDEYTPSTESVEDCYAMDPESEYRNPINYGSTVRANRRAFHRWLAAHDAEVARQQAEHDAEIAASVTGVPMHAQWGPTIAATIRAQFETAND